MSTKITRRAVLAGAAAAIPAAVAIPAVALSGQASGEPDPIFAAIERHQGSLEPGHRLASRGRGGGRLLGRPRNDENGIEGLIKMLDAAEGRLLCAASAYLEASPATKLEA